MNMLIRIGDILPDIRSIEEIVIPRIFTRELQRAINEAKDKRPKQPLLQLYKKIKAIVVKILCKVNQFDHHNQLITENILTQSTYYKTLTSRP